MKNKIIISLVFVFIFALILSSNVEARKGVGIIWDTETAIVNEDSVHCVDYGLYNPWNEDVNAMLGVSDELRNVITETDTEPVFIEAETYHEDNIPTQLCFKVANVYEEDCLLFGTLCAQKCDNMEEVKYSGRVTVNEKPKESTQGTTGSATSLGISVPLDLRIQCSESPRNWTFIYYIIIVLAIVAIVMIFIKRHNASKEPPEGMIETETYK